MNAPTLTHRSPESQPLASESRQPHKITWHLLVELEPRLLDLYERARAVKDDKRKPWFCANRVWYSTFKPRLLDLVGWRRRDHPILGTSLAYEISYDEIYGALPFCRNCACTALYGFVQRRLDR